MSSSLLHDAAVPVAIIIDAPPPDSGSTADHMKEKKKMKKTKEEVESCTSASGSCNEPDAVLVVVVRAMAAADVESCDRPAETKLQIQSGDESERGCRICHLSRYASDHDSDDGLIELGCACKDDLAAAHRHCAETWFNIKGDKICEICGSIACNLSENLLMEGGVGGSGNNSTGADAEPPTEAANNCWQGQRLLNFVLACVIFFFVISWLFHFNVPA